MRFEDFPIRREIIDALHARGFVEPTPIQAQAIPLALEDRDVLGIAQTGTGKTLAFLVPILDKLVRRDHPQVLVVCPTRELAQQVAGVATDLGDDLGLRTALVHGGTSSGGQRRELDAGVDIVVGTPGRLLDFVGSAWLRPRYLRWLVLDEADRMLDMGFIDDVVRLCARMPLSRQTMLFSATMPDAISEIVHRFMLEPETVRVEPERVTAAGIEQRLHVVRPQDKTRALLSLLDEHRGKKVLVFTATREATSEVARTLRREGHEVVSLSSLLSQNNRERALDGFRSGDYDVLVATDVAGRGLDVVDIDVVVNYDLPHNPEDYVHRVGRTGRAEREGLAISLATPRDAPRLAGVERVLGVSIERAELDRVETLEMGRSSARRPSRGKGRGRRQGGGRRRRGDGGGGGAGRPRNRRD